MSLYKKEIVKFFITFVVTGIYRTKHRNKLNQSGQQKQIKPVGST